MTSLCIVQEGSGRATSIVRVLDRELLTKAAMRAISDAHGRADDEEDPLIAVVHAEEAERLSRTLKLLIPELHETKQREIAANAASTIN